MDVFDAIWTMRATRVYQPKPIPSDALDRILEAATRACSSGNTQPWEFVVVTDADLKANLKKVLSEAWVTIDSQRAQTPDQLVDGSGRPVTGHQAIENIDVVAA